MLSQNLLNERAFVFVVINEPEERGRHSGEHSRNVIRVRLLLCSIYRDRLSEIAEAASDAGLDTDGARAALRSAMNSQTPAPFPDDMQREALARLTGMLDYIRWKATQVD